MISNDVSFGICEAISIAKNSNYSNSNNNLLFRYFNIINVGNKPIHIVRIKLSDISNNGNNNNNNTITLFDDFGIAKNSSNNDLNNKVLLLSGDHYGICIQLDLSKAIPGVEERHILFTICFNNNNVDNNNSNNIYETFHRRINYVVARRPDEIRFVSQFNIEATPFVPDHLRLIFSSPPARFLSVTLNRHFYEKPTGTRYAITAPAYTHAVLIQIMNEERHANKSSFVLTEINNSNNNSFPSNNNRNKNSVLNNSKDTDKCLLVSKTNIELKKHLTLLLVESLAQERHMQTFDVFNQPIFKVN